jgi:hypothetical protein
VVCLHVHDKPSPNGGGFLILCRTAFMVSTLELSLVLSLDIPLALPLMLVEVFGQIGVMPLLILVYVTP